MRTLTAMVAALALVLVACGGSEESQVATTQPAQITATTIAPEAATTTPPTTAPEPITTTTEAPRVDPATALIGVWRLHSGYMTFREDDTWTYTILLSLDPSDGGGYEFEDGVLTFTADVGSCVGTGTGIYEVVFERQDEMAWTAVSDECDGRLYLTQETDPDVKIQDTIPRHIP